MSSSITNSDPDRRPLRRYVAAVIGLAVGWLVATMAANILVDPQAMFGLDLLRSHVNPNLRYAALRTYLAAPEHYDAVLFGSSRGNAFDRALLAEQMGVREVANFSVPFGLLSDHLPVLEYLLHDKAAHGGRLAAVFLLMDADFFGKQPWTNLNIDSFLPPQLSGENPLRFWWRYLTAFQFRNWKNDLAASAKPVADAGASRPHRPPAWRRPPSRWPMPGRRARRSCAGPRWRPGWFRCVRSRRPAAPPCRSRSTSSTHRRSAPTCNTSSTCWPAS
jgi:hypothetical protein